MVDKIKKQKNSKIKYEISKPTFLIPSKIDKFLQKKEKKTIDSIDEQNQRKIDIIKKKINLLQEILTKKKSHISSHKQKNSLSRDKTKKNNNNIKKNNISKNNDSLTAIQKTSHIYNTKVPFQINTNNVNQKHVLFNSFQSKLNSDNVHLLKDSKKYIGLRYNKDLLFNKQKENSNKKKKNEDNHSNDLARKDKIRNTDNYSIDKENTSIDKSINFNQIKSNEKGEKNDIKNNVIHPYKNKSSDILLSNIDINNNLIPNSHITPDNNNSYNLNNLGNIINLNPNSNNSNSDSKKNNHSENLPNNEQIKVKNLENIFKDTPSTKNTLKAESKLADIIYKNNNKIVVGDNSMKNSGHKKKYFNKSMNSMNGMNSSKKKKFISNSSKKHLKDNKNNSNNNESKSTDNNKFKNTTINNKIIKKKINSQFTNSSFLELTTSHLYRYNITNLPSKKNIKKRIISLKRAPMYNKLNFNSPIGFFGIKKNYESTADINKKYKKNKRKKSKHSSFNFSQSMMKKIQENHYNNTTKNKNSIKKINKTEKHSNSSTYKNHIKINDSNNLNNNQKNSLDSDEEKEGIPRVFSVTLRQNGFKQKELSNITKRLSSSQCDISLKNDIFENLKNNYKYKEPKYVKAIENLCKKGFSGPGIKKTNQDNFFIFNNFNNNSNYIYMGVCDGHGIFGQDISSYLVNNLPQNLNNEIINKNIKNLSTEKISKLSEILESTFIQTNINLNTDERIDSTFSGSTCASILFTPTRLICINVGDSRCVMGKLNNNKWSSKNLTRDHKPNEQDEMERIIAYGGKVEQFKDNLGNFAGPQRVWLKEGNAPGLAMSRSFGDEIAHTIGVIVNPEINEYQLLNEDKFIILASDGIWEFITSEEAVNIVQPFYIDNDIEGAITRLYKEASKRWIMEEEVIDDITIILVFLN